MKNEVAIKDRSMTTPLPLDFREDKAFWIEKLQEELSGVFEYHTAEHTERVVHIAHQICQYEQLSENETLAVLYAALFHDAGFLNSDQDHEAHSALLAKNHLEEKGFSAPFVKDVEKLILATHLSYDACQHLECIICDADLEYLGTDDYFEVSDNLRLEWANLGREFTDLEWLNLQVKFLKEHAFKTGWAIENREGGKQKNLSELQNRLLHSK